MNKILFLFPNDPNPRFIKRMELSSKEGLETHLLYWDRGINTPYRLPLGVFEDKIYLPVTLADHKNKLLNLPRFYGKAIKKIMKIKPNIIHAGLFEMAVLAVMYKIFVNWKVKIVYEIGDLPKYIINEKSGFKELIRKIAINMEKLTCRFVDKIVLTSPFFWEKYYSKFMKKEKYLFMPNAPAKYVFNNYKQKKQQEKLVIGYIGFVRYKEQIVNLINAVQGYKEYFDIHIYGEGPDANFIKEYISQNHYGDFVQMKGAYNYVEEISSIYSNVDLVYSVYDTSFENVKLALPNKLYEAIVTEKPIIVANNTELEKFVKKYDIGFSVSDINSTSLEELLEYIMKDKNIIQQKSLNCRKIRESHFVDSYNSKLMKIYNN